MSEESPGMTELQLSSAPAPCVRPPASSPRWISSPQSTVSKVSGIDGSKPCHFECEGTEGFKQVYALARWTQEPRSRCRCGARDPHHLRFFSIRQPHQRWGLLASWTQPWCWCWRCFCRWRSRLDVADVAVKSFKFRLVAVYAPNSAVERVSFFRRLAPSWMIRSG